MKNYDLKKPSKYITYLDENNLSSWVMSGYLRYGKFKWLTQEKIENLDVNTISENSSTGYSIEVDLVYPKELHELRNDYPLAPEKLAIPFDMLLGYCKKNSADKYRIKVGDIKKLVPNLDDKSNYVVHYRNPQLHLSLGRKLTKIHRVLKFKQCNWIKKYIDFNSAVNSFEKDLFKSMINSVSGNTMENLRKRISVKLVNNERDFLKHVSKPIFITQKKFNKYFAAIHEIKPVLTLNKPIYVGFMVLELSKWLMYDFHYNIIKKNFDANLLFTDTDSVTYEIKSEDAYEEFLKHKHLLDVSEYQSKYFDPSNKILPKLLAK